MRKALVLFFFAGVLVMMGCTAPSAAQQGTMGTEPTTAAPNGQQANAPAATPSPAPTATAAPMTETDSGSMLTLNIVPNNSGSVAMDGMGTQASGYLVGDDADNTEWRAFLSFDLSSLQPTLNIQQVTLRVSCNVLDGSPDDLGGIRVAVYPYGTFDPLGLSNSSLRGAEEVFGNLNCPASEFDVTEAFLRVWGQEGSASFDLIVTAANGSDGDAAKDLIEVTGAQLGVDYAPGSEDGQAPPQAAPTATAEEACTDAVMFVGDLGLEDNATLAPQRIFSKGWRLKNVGNCTWDSNYQVVFVGGDRMNAPAATPLPETVPPGGTVDVYVDLVAPEQEGTYQGNFELRDPKGYTIGTDFWVRIRVQSNADTNEDTSEATPTLQPQTFIVEPNAANSGSFSLNGSAATAFYVGDDEYNDLWVTVLDFGLNDIQPPAVLEATLELDCALREGNAFANLGGYQVSSAVYGAFVITQAGSSLQLQDIQFLDYLGALDSHCVPVEFDVTASVQNYFADAVGNAPYQIVITPLQQTSNGDNAADILEIPSARLIITATP